MITVNFAKSGVQPALIFPTLGAFQSLGYYRKPVIEG